MVALKQIAGYHPSAFWETPCRCCYCNRCAYLLRHERAVYNGKIIVGALMPFVPAWLSAMACVIIWRVI